VAPTQLDRANSIIAGDVDTLDKIFEPLYITSAAGQLTPWLATGYTTSPDHVTWTFQLRPGVRFSDGTPLTADDVVWSIAREQANSNGPLSFLDFAVTKIKADGSGTVVFTLSQRGRLGLSLVFVSHDLAVVRQVCDELAVMYTGRIVETGPARQVLAEPLHPYSRGLLDATIDLDQPERPVRPIPGSIPEPGLLPPGCSFHPRCGYATEECARTDVKLVPVAVKLAGVGRDGDAGRGAGLEAPLRNSACLHRRELATR